jgi:energy-coupling factor transporter ATP-binding protein EcfA2
MASQKTVEIKEKTFSKFADPLPNFEDVNRGIDTEPYVGFSSYLEEDVFFFFGREDQIEEILQELNTKRLTVVYGEGGVGKSSLLRAGVVHAIHQQVEENKIRETTKEVAVVFPPLDEKEVCQKEIWESNDIIGKLLCQIQEKIKELYPTIKLSDLQTSEESLGNIHSKQKLPKSEAQKAGEKSRFVATLENLTKVLGDDRNTGYIYIILDQFEDYFLDANQNNSKAEFIEEIACAINTYCLSVQFLISIRSNDYYKIENLKGYLPSIYDNVLELKHFDRESAKEAIIKPLARYNCLESIIDHLKHNRLTILTGTVGIGKSFMLKEGVIRYLERQAKENTKTVQPCFFVIYFDSWNGDSLQNLVRQIKDTIQPYLCQNKTKNNVIAGLDNLSEILRFWRDSLESQYGKLLIILDQFEQYFAKSQINEKFANEIGQIIRDKDLMVHCLISIREDCSWDKFCTFISKLTNEIPIWSEQYLQLSKDCVYLKSFKDKEQNLSIPKTVDFEEGLVDQILDKLPDQKSKTSQEVQITAPYLQVVMTQLWEEKEDKDKNGQYVITKNKFENLGGLEGIIKTSMNTRMQELFSIEGEQELKKAQHIISYFLTPSGGKNLLSVSDLVAYTKDEAYNLNLLPLKLEEGNVINILKKLSDARILHSLGLSTPRYELYLSQLAPAIQEVRAEYIRYVHSLTVIQRLPAESLRQLRRRRDDLAALLAYEAYQFNKKRELGILNHVDEALREALSLDNFGITLSGHTEGVESVAFNPDGTLLASGSHDGRIAIWNLTTPYEHQNNHQPTFFLDPPDSTQQNHPTVWSIAFHPDKDKRILIAGKEDGNVELWDLNGNIDSDKPIPNRPHKILWTHDHVDKREKRVNAVVFNQDGSILASGGNDGKIRLSRSKTHPKSGKKIDVIGGKSLSTA